MARRRVQIPEGTSGGFEIAHFRDTTTTHNWQVYREMKDEPHSRHTVLLSDQCNMPIMQDSEAEHREHQDFFDNANGSVLIAGLGIGFVNEYLKDMDNVTSITIVEKYQDVIDLVWPYCEKDDRYTLVHDDIETWVPPEGSYWDYAWFDAWVFNNEMSYEDHMALMQERYTDYIGSSGQWISKQLEA